MKKLFISQPMNGKSDKEIRMERNSAISAACDVLGEPVEPIDSFFQGCDHLNHPLQFLGESLKLLAQADISYFAPGWEHARGCKIEHDCAVAYGIPTIEAE